MADTDPSAGAGVDARPPSGDPDDLPALGGSVEPDPEPDPEPVGRDVMSLTGHLGELRNRVLWSLGAIIIGAVVGFLASETIISILRAPLPLEQPLVFTSVGDPFAIRLRIAIVGGIILAMPVLLFHLWRFISPGLTPSERRIVAPWIPAALVLFVMGVGIAYVVLPFAAAFLLSFQTADLQALITAREYFDFVSTMFLAFGLLMEFPIVLFALSRVGIVTSERLTRSRRVVVLGIAIFAAAVTPGGDLVSPGILGLTMYLLFEITVWLIRRTGR
jgi:sec-independent protein translocase protein TatC